MNPPAFSTAAPARTLVSVVVPAYNSSLTLAQTLESILQQTHRAIEVIVVDDGSGDGTLGIATDVAARDSRLRVISQENRGVAAARNAGVEASTGEFIAFTDADDLWHPRKLEMQLGTLLARGASYGFVYSPCRIIDSEGFVTTTEAPFSVEGPSFLQTIYCYYARNGSSWLCRRSAVEAVAGFDISLRSRNLQGVEDHLFSVRIARRWKVAACPLFLVGYRWLPHSMSRDANKMLRSTIAALELVRSTDGEVVPRRVWRWTIAYARLGAAMPQLRISGWRGWAVKQLGLAAISDPIGFLDFAIERAMVWRYRSSLERLGRRAGSAAAGIAATSRKHFYDMAVDEGPVLQMSPLRSDRLRRLAMLDREIWALPRLG